MIDRKGWFTALVLGLSGVACEQVTINDTKPIFETSFPPPATPDQPFILVRAAGPVTRPETIGRIAVSGDYLFFVSITDGIYRMPKYGGDLSTVEEDLHGSFRNVAANATDVFWDHTTYDKNNRGHLSIHRRAIAGGPTVTMLEVDGEVPASLLVDEQAAFLFTANEADEGWYHAVLRRIPVDGSPPTVLMADVTLWSTSWVMDGDYLYFDSAPPLDDASTLTRMLKTGGPVETITQFRSFSGIATADDRFLYGYGYLDDNPEGIAYVMGFSLHLESVTPAPQPLQPRTSRGA